MDNSKPSKPFVLKHSSYYQSMILACILILLLMVFTGCKENINSSSDTVSADNITQETQEEQSEKTSNTNSVITINAPDGVEPVSCRNKPIVEAFMNHESDVQVKGCGTVIKVLADDNKGSRHQKMIVELDDIDIKHTILIAHNIDLAPRINGLKEGDKIMFYGEYEYTEKGGVVHWTHYDPAGRHQDGWLELDGKRYG